jgi:hypothetical protein
MVEWSEDHVATIGSVKLNLWFSWWILIKLETGRGPVGEKGRPSVGKVREWYVESWRLCQLRTDGLALWASIERTDRLPVIWAR